MDIASVTAAYNGLKIGKEILSAFLETKIESESRARVAEVLSKLGQAQDALFELREELFKLQSENESLRRQIGQFESWDKTLSGYSLAKTAGGAVVYVSKGTPEHYACPSCIAKRELQILQDNRTYSGKFRCTGCKAEFPVNPRRDPPMEAANLDPPW